MRAIRTRRTNNKKPKMSRRSNYAESDESGETSKDISSVNYSLLSIINNSEKTSEDLERNKKILDAIIYFMCTECKSFNIIEGKGFQKLMHVLYPLYKVPRKNIIKRRLDVIYCRAIRTFKKRLNEASHVTVTLNTWSSSKTCKNFLEITMHFTLDNIRNLQSVTVEVAELFECTAENIMTVLMNTLKKWHVIDKVSAVVANREHKLSAAIMHTFGESKYTSCFAHALYRIGHNSIKKCKGLDKVIDKMRSVIKFVKENVEIRYEVHRSTDNSMLPGLDTKTAWTNVYYMIKQFVKLSKNIAEVLHAQRTKYPEMPEMLTTDELLLLNETLNMLRPLEFVVRECSAVRYIELSKILPFIRCLLLEYQKCVTSELLTKLSQIIQDEIIKEFGERETMNDNIATLLDPRFKTLYCINDNSRNKIITSLREKILHTTDSDFDKQEKRKECTYDLWNNHKTLMQNGDKDREMISKDEVELYLASPFADLNEDPLEKWKDMKLAYPKLYNTAMKYLSIVSTSLPMDHLFTKQGTKIAESRTRLVRKKFDKQLFMHSMNDEYWFG